MAIIFILEIAVTISLYAYKDKLSDGFDRGLNESMKEYGDSSSVTSHFDFMQAEVKCCRLTFSNSYKI